MPSAPDPSSVDPRARLDHGAIGNGRLIALVAPTSAIEWLCMPRFDSPSVFARILDKDHGGTFAVHHRDGEVRGAMKYLPNTNVLTTRFAVGNDAWDVIDFAPRLPDGLDVNVPLEVVRIVRPVLAQPRLRIHFDPRPNYARTAGTLVQSTHAIDVHGADVPIQLATNLPAAYVLSAREFSLTEPLFFVMTCGRRDVPPTLASVLHDLERTTAGWRVWTKSLALPTFAAVDVLRSALCLKLHAYHDTGAVIAAATTSIPEAMGTMRTWDYRYCWLRDAAFVVEALRRLGQLSEGESFIRFLRDVAEAGPLQPLYAIDGRRDLEEFFLDHLAGFGGNGHVRVGNAAALQRQNDLMGELVLCIETLLSDPRIVYDDAAGYFPLIERLVEEAIVAAPTTDTGIWEFRTMLRQYTFSRAMCWVAAHRGAALAVRFGVPEVAARWQAAATAEQAIILERGYNAELGYFTQTLDGDAPDASNLLLATIGLVDARDPRFVSTVDAYGRRLGRRRVDASIPRARRLRQDDERVHDLLVLVGRSARARRSPRRSARDVSADRSLRQPRRALLRGHRSGDGRAARKLPAGVHPRRAHPRRDDGRRAPRVARRKGSGVDRSATGRLVIVANRSPVTLKIERGDVSMVASAGGLATGLRRLHTKSEGLWIGWRGDTSTLDDGTRARAWTRNSRPNG